MWKSASQFRPSLLWPILLACAAGCGDRMDCVPVSGKVLIDGQPLTFGAVVFVPDNGRQSMGVIDQEGRFKLTCYEPDDGAILGTHRVQVLANESLNVTTIKWHAPTKYNNVNTSGLVQDIKEPTDEVVIDLTWKGSTPDKPYIEHLDANAAEEAFGKYRERSKQESSKTEE